MLLAFPVHLTPVPPILLSQYLILVRYPPIIPPCLPEPKQASSLRPIPPFFAAADNGLEETPSSSLHLISPGGSVVPHPPGPFFVWVNGRSLGDQGVSCEASCGGVGNPSRGRATPVGRGRGGCGAWRGTARSTGSAVGGGGCPGRRRRRGLEGEILVSFRAGCPNTPGLAEVGSGDRERPVSGDGGGPPNMNGRVRVCVQSSIKHSVSLSAYTSPSSPSR